MSDLVNGGSTKWDREHTKDQVNWDVGLGVGNEYVLGQKECNITIYNK